MEIERKFLVKPLVFSLDRYERLEIEQAYISTDPVIRLRKSNEDYFITFKKRVDLVSNEEYEFPITGEQYTRLWKKVETKAVKKSRYRIPLEGSLVAEFDIYYGELSGLKTVEVEFPDSESCRAFCPPAWFGKDISGDYRYKNNYLAVHGLPRDFYDN